MALQRLAFKGCGKRVFPAPAKALSTLRRDICADSLRGDSMTHSATRIAEVFYNAARRRFEAVVEFFAPGMPSPLRVPVILAIPQATPHPHLARALAAEAARRGIGSL
jgi:hypothetical protein